MTCNLNEFLQIDEEFAGEDINEFSTDEIRRVMERFVFAAGKVKNRKCGLIVVDASCGTVLGNFVSGRVNKRTDQWGGSVENRMRLPRMVLKKIRKLYGIPIEFRMSGAEFVPNGYTVEEGIEIAKEVDGIADIIYVTAGVDKYKSTSTQNSRIFSMLHGSNLRLASQVRQHVKAKIATVAGLGEPRMMDDIIASGKVDILYNDIA